MKRIARREPREEHGEETHGLFVYDSTIRVPLIVRFPESVPAGSRYAVIVSGVEIAPTVLGLMGHPPMTGVNGGSHAEGLRTGRPPVGEPVYAESVYPERAYGWAPLAALRGPRQKYIDAPEPGIYDLESDPGERTNLAPDRADGVRDGAAARAAHDYLRTIRGGQVSATLNIVSVDLGTRSVVISRNSHCPVIVVHGPERELQILNEPSENWGLCIAGEFGERFNSPAVLAT